MAEQLNKPITVRNPDTLSPQRQERIAARHRAGVLQRDLKEAEDYDPAVASESRMLGHIRDSFRRVESLQERCAVLAAMRRMRQDIGPDAERVAARHEIANDIRELAWTYAWLAAHLDENALLTSGED